jgi:hypothetical protein
MKEEHLNRRTFLGNTLFISGTVIIANLAKASFVTSLINTSPKELDGIVEKANNEIIEPQSIGCNCPVRDDYL